MLDTIRQVARLWGHLLPRRKWQLGLVAVLMVVVSLTEVLIVGAVVPFLGVLTAPEKVFSHDLTQPFVKFLKIEDAEQLLLPVTLLFITAAIFAGLTRIALFWAQLKVATAIGVDLSRRVYEIALYQGYSVHVSRNSSELLAGISKATNLVGSIIQPVMLTISSSLILILVLSTLLAIQPLATLLTILIFGLAYAFIVFITRRKVSQNSQIIAAHQGKLVKIIQEGLGGIRDVLLHGNQKFYSKLYRDAAISMQSAIASNQIVGASPRYIVEAIGMVLLAGLAYSITLTNAAREGVSTALPLLGALAMGAQRLLPVLQQIYHAYITMNGNQAGNQDALDLLDQPLYLGSLDRPVAPMAFQTALKLIDLGFRYTPRGQWVFRHLNLEITKGSRVGLVGPTGSGKSTLFDVVMGLHTPTEGMLMVDNTAVDIFNARNWQVNISHVPQTIFLSDTSIAENIAFGISADRIDLKRVKRAAQQAKIDEVIESWSKGYDTLVGERGVRLSGGQRQRIGIARALYRHANVIIFDEATSALDHETETEVMKIVGTLPPDVTVLIIAHRLTTLRYCDKIVELASGAIKVMDGYEALPQA